MALQNPVNDATAIAKKLVSLGFRVTTVTDVNATQMKDALRSFKVISAGADVGVLFYSGHGAFLDGNVYMIPVDASATDKAELIVNSVPLYSAVEKFMDSKRKIAFYDSNLDDPFQTPPALSTNSYPQGALMAFAANLGSVASDGRGKNSPFTSALLAHLSDPDDIALVLRKVRAKVIKETNGQQQPWEYGALTSGKLVLSNRSVR